MKHLLKLGDLTRQELLELLALADQLKFENKNKIAHPLLQGKTLGMIFAKSSTRTRVSFEVGMYQLGGHALFLNTNDLQLGRGEPITDTARVLSRYLDGIMIRTFRQEDVDALAAYGSIPVVNGLTDFAHPCQVLADLMTIRECRGSFDGLKLAFVGDGNNMANSLMAGCFLLGIRFAIACPMGYEPDAALVRRGTELDLCTVTDSVEDAVKDADVVYTDVWASMGQEGERGERQKAFQPYRVDAKTMGYAKPDAMVLHCLPAHRGEEISADVFERHASEIFDQAENRLHAQKAVLVALMRQK